MKRKIRHSGADPGPPPREVLRCGALRVDAAARQAWLGDALLELQPKVFDLLLLLLREPGVVHTRESLFARLWPGAVILDSNLTTALSQLRRALDEPTRAWVRTVPRVGYAFDGEVVVEAGALDEAADATATGAPVTVPSAGSAGAGPVSEAGVSEDRATAASAAHRPAPPWIRRLPILLAIVLAACVIVLLAARRDPAAERPILVLGAIGPDAGVDAPRWIGLAVRDALQRRLGADPALRVVDHAAAAGASLVAGARSGGAVGADYVLEGRYATGATVQDPIRLSLAVRDARDGRALWSADRELARSELLLGVDALADALHAHLRPGRPPPARAAAVPIDAVEAYTDGLRALARGDYLAARRDLERAVALEPGFAAAEVRLAEVLRELGHQALAAAIYRRLGADDGAGDADTEPRRLARARALALEGEIVPAIAAFRALVAAYPDDPRHATELARALSRHDEAARREARRLLAGLAARTELADWDVRRLLALGVLEERDGRLQAAADALAAARERATRAGLFALAGDAGIDLGRHLQRLGRLDDARVAWRQAQADQQRAGMPAGEAAATLNLLLAERWADPPADPAVVRAGIESMIAKARELGATHLEAQGATLLAEHLSMNGDVVSAVPLVDQAVALFDRLGDPLLGDQARVLAGRLRVDLGQPAAALAILDPLSQRFGLEMPQRQVVDQARVDALLQRGEVAAARRLAGSLVAESAQRGTGPVELALAHCTAFNALRTAGAEAEATAAFAGCRAEPRAAPAANLDLIEVDLSLQRGEPAPAAEALRRAAAAVDAMAPGVRRDALQLQLAVSLLRVGSPDEARMRWRQVDGAGLARFRAGARVSHALLASAFALHFDRDPKAARAAIAEARMHAGPEWTMAQVEIDLFEAATFGADQAARRSALVQGAQAAAASSGNAPLARLADALADALARAPDGTDGASWLALDGGLPGDSPYLRVEPPR